MQVHRTLWKYRTYRRRSWQNCGMINILLILEVRWTIAKEKMVKVRDFTETYICVPGLLAQIGHQLLIMMLWGKTCMYMCVTENKGDRSGWPRIISSSVLVAYQGASLITVWITTKKAQLSNWYKQLTSGASPHVNKALSPPGFMSCHAVDKFSFGPISPLIAVRIWKKDHWTGKQENVCAWPRSCPATWICLLPLLSAAVLMDPHWRAGYNSEPPGTAFLKLLCLLACFVCLKKLDHSLNLRAHDDACSVFKFLSA